jgi:hypothetical protein
VPTTGLLILIAGRRILRNIDPDQPLRYFSWTRFAIVAALYTAIVFWLGTYKDGPTIFSGRNARSRWQVLLAHVMFLIILFCCFRIFPYIVPSLPFWMTDMTTVRRRGSRSSFVECVLYLGAFGMAYFERRWLYNSVR